MEASDTDLIIRHNQSDRKLHSAPLPFDADGQIIAILKVCLFKGNFIDIKYRKLIEIQFIINFERNTFCLNIDIFVLCNPPTNQHISLKDQSSNNAIVIKEAEKRLAITMIIKEDYVTDSICVILKISSLLSKNYPGLQCACVMDNLIS